jgi:aquaporin Z
MDAAAELILEFLLTGVFVGVVVGCGGQPLAVGASLALLVFVGGLLGSGAAHLNPAITLGLVAGRRVGVARGLALVAAQVLAGLLAVFLVAKYAPLGVLGGGGPARK